jgi:hypothetical protein
MGWAAVAFCLTALPVAAQTVPLTVTVVANAAAAQQPGRLSGGTGRAVGCALSTCAITMTNAFTTFALVRVTLH